MTPRDFVTGDGVNLSRDSNFRRVDTANGAINAPNFLASAFPMYIPNQVNIDGTADLNTEIDLYRVNGSIDPNLRYGPLSEYLTTVKTDANGKFGASLNNLKVGDTISAIATDPQYGTSEPAFNARIVNPNLSVPTITNIQSPIPACTTPPQIVQVPRPSHHHPLQSRYPFHVKSTLPLIATPSAQRVPKFLIGLRWY